MTAPSPTCPPLLETPGDRLVTVLQLADELAEVANGASQVVSRVEQATGLRRGELAALTAVDEGAWHPRAVARRSGQVDDAGDPTTEALLRRGLLRRSTHRGTPPGVAGATALEVTEAGRVVLQQAEGLRIRLLDVVVGALGPRDTAVLRAAVRALAGALDGAARTGDAGCREIDSRGVGPLPGP